MDGLAFQAERGYALDRPGHPQGVSCNAQGPALGPIQLLVRTPSGFEPRPVDELNAILGWTFARPFDSSGLSSGLQTIARALNDGNLARAMIATQQLRLPFLDESQARRAQAAMTMLKASADDPKRPGWPAGTPNSLGGKFRPKNGELSADARSAAVDRLNRLVRRRWIRFTLRTLLNARRFMRLARIGFEAASNAVPGVDVVGDTAMAVDLPYQIADTALLIGEFVQLKTLTDAAVQFANNGPYTLDQLRKDPNNRSFSSFDAFKKIDIIKFYGPAPPGYEYHHIVEQSAENDIPASELNSTWNIVVIPKLIHEEINSEYAQSASDENGGGVTIRDSLKGKPFEEQYEQGLETMRKIGILQ